jgi:hypothetical protein
MNEGYEYSGTSASNTTYSNEENPYSWIRYQEYQFYKGILEETERIIFGNISQELDRTKDRYSLYRIDPFFEESKSDTLKNNTKLLKIL